MALQAYSHAMFPAKRSTLRWASQRQHSLGDTEVKQEIGTGLVSQPEAGVDAPPNQ